MQPNKYGDKDIDPTIRLRTMRMPPRPFNGKVGRRKRIVNHAGRAQNLSARRDRRKHAEGLDGIGKTEEYDSKLDGRRTCPKRVSSAPLPLAFYIEWRLSGHRSRAHGPFRVSLFLGRHKTTIDLGASRYFVASKRIPSSEKSSGLGKEVSTILFHSCAVPSCTLNSNSSQ
jgi:hypothetical protein